MKQWIKTWYIQKRMGSILFLFLYVKFQSIASLLSYSIHDSSAGKKIVGHSKLKLWTFVWDQSEHEWSYMQSHQVLYMYMYNTCTWLYMYLYMKIHTIYICVHVSKTGTSICILLVFSNIQQYYFVDYIHCKVHVHGVAVCGAFVYVHVYMYYMYMEYLYMQYILCTLIFDMPHV